MTGIIIQQIHDFFNVLNPNFSTGHAEIFTARILDSHGKDIVPGLGTIFGTEDELIAITEREYSKSGVTLHVILNRTSDKGSSSAHVQSVRVLCVDLDTLTELEDLKTIVRTYEPTCVVESSPKKYHLYWRCASEIPLSVWEEIQLGLAVKFGGDRNLAQRTHSIRVPGIPRITKEGSIYTPNIVHLTPDSEELNYRTIIEKFDGLNGYIETGKKHAKKKKTAISAIVKDPSKLKTKAVLLEHRNDTVYFYIQAKTLEGKGNLTLDEAYVLAQNLNNEFPVINGKEPLDEKELQKAATQGFRYGEMLLEAEKERIAELTQSWKDTAGDCEFQYDYSDKFLRINRFTEMSVKARIVQRFSGNIIKVDKAIYAFNSTDRTWSRQSHESHAELYEFAQEAALDTLKDPAFIQDCCMDSKGQPSELARKAAQEKYMRLSLVSNAAWSARSDKKVKQLKPSDFDANPSLLYCANGVLDMQSLNLRAAEPTDLMFNQTDVTWNSEAKCSWWENYLKEVFGKNENPESTISFMQELFGYSISGLINAQKIFCHFGDGCNGKSKVLSALSKILGDYATYIDPDDIVTKKNAYAKALERVGAKVEGHRTVIVDDISTQAVWNEAFVKNLTGTVIRARAENERSRVFANRASIHMGLNKPPDPEEENEGILRRVCLIPYVEQFTHSPQKSDEIDAAIEREKEGILVWAVKGYQRYVAQKGFAYTPEMTQAIDEYKEDHFKCESLVKDLFTKYPDTELKLDPPYLFTSDLVKELNDYLRYSESLQQITPEEMGRAFKRKFGLSAKKVWCNKRKNMYKAYQIKRNYEVQDDKSLMTAIMLNHVG